ncbi:alpha/beta fold hydrolase [Caldivirga maquilingensis]|uniref:alpha/beta fold hydrolase n=1 Tax=Caldivirga maquilingensis TaxID=76887 RepID=UPI00064FF2C5|nr:alpha/beta hydrolase [Caldivirga maquilingensis]
MIAENYVNVGNYRVRYLENGDGEVVLIIVPPPNASANRFMNVIKGAAAAGFKVIHVDLSSAPASMSKANKVAALSYIINALNGKRIILAGVGQGGGIALDYVTQTRQNTISGIVLVSTPRVINRIDELPKLNIPMLLIYSINDPNAPVEEANAVKSVIKNSRLMLINSDWLSELDKVTQFMVSWMLELTKSDTTSKGS